MVTSAGVVQGSWITRPWQRITEMNSSADLQAGSLNQAVGRPGLLSLDQGKHPFSLLANICSLPCVDSLVCGCVSLVCGCVLSWYSVHLH